jgi:4a-hydroxytetrahydrobiopterin dehydratase
VSSLISKHCIPCKGGVPLTREQAEELRKQTPEWQIIENQSAPPRARTLKISRTFKFKNFKETRAFFNAVADIADAENHHPNFEISYRQCTLTLWTHAIGGLSENDFIVAAKMDQIA